MLIPERGFFIASFFFILMFFLSVLLPKELSKVQDNEVGDGTTSVTVLACELLRVLLSVTDYFYTQVPSWTKMLRKMDVTMSSFKESS